MNKSKFHLHPNINPKTNLPVIIGSKEYLKLVDEYGEVKIKSPKTGWKIAIGKGEYKKLIKGGYNEENLLALLSSDVKYPKTNKLLEQEIIHSLYDITTKNIVYYESLDYVDLKNLCDINKNFSNICKNNTLLRQIAFDTIPNLQLPPNYDISTPLNDLYNEIVKLVVLNYPPKMFYPKYINRELLLEEMKKKVYYDLSSRILNIYYATKTNNLTKLYDDIKEHICINKIVLALPFAGKEANGIELYYGGYGLEDHTSFEFVENELILPKTFLNYIKLIFDHWNNINYYVDEDDFQSILFIRPYIFDVFQ